MMLPTGIPHDVFGFHQASQGKYKFLCHCEIASLHALLMLYIYRSHVYVHEISEQEYCSQGNN